MLPSLSLEQKTMTYLWFARTLATTVVKPTNVRQFASQSLIPTGTKLFAGMAAFTFTVNELNKHQVYAYHDDDDPWMREEHDRYDDICFLAWCVKDATSEKPKLEANNLYSLLDNRYLFSAFDEDMSLTVEKPEVLSMTLIKALETNNEYVTQFVLDVLIKTKNLDRIDYSNMKSDDKGRVMSHLRKQRKHDPDAIDKILK